MNSFPMNLLHVTSIHMNLIHVNLIHINLFVEKVAKLRRGTLPLSVRQRYAAS